MESGDDALGAFGMARVRITGAGSSVMIFIRRSYA